MAEWISTEEVMSYLGIGRDAITALLRAPVERPAWVLYAGVHGRRSARYRWRADRLDDWFEEAAAWRAANAEAARRDSTRAAPRRGSSKSTVRHAGESLVELAERLIAQQREE